MSQISQETICVFLKKLQINDILNNISYLGVKIKKAKTRTADTLKICRFMDLR